MRLLVISDIHADAAALERVLADAARHSWDEALFLGDAVGYGEEAHEVVERLRSLPLRAGLRGNHEQMLESLRRSRRPNAGRAVIGVLERNLVQLTRGDLAFLDALEGQYLADSWGAVHGALRKPFEYLISVPTARSNASHMKRDTYFVGHTHVPAAYLQEPGGDWKLRSFGTRGGVVSVPQGSRAFLNPGSVSLPRDGSTGSSYAIFDEERGEFTIRRLRN